MSGGESNPPAGDGGKVERKELFISYSHKDRYFLEQFWVFLKPLEEDYGLQRWDDSRIKSGDYWRDEIQQALKRAQVAMLLVSPHFLASDFIRRVELPSLFEAAKHDGMKILWLPIRPCSWRRHPQFEQYQSVGSLDPTLAEMKKVKRDREMVSITDHIHDLFEGIQKERVATQQVAEAEAQHPEMEKDGLKQQELPITPHRVTQPNAPESQGLPLIQIPTNRGWLVREGNAWRKKEEAIMVKGYREELEKGIAITMIHIPGGEFSMGSTAAEADRKDHESPQHKVKLRSFFLGQTPVTQAQWKVVADLPKQVIELKVKPSRFRGDNRPVEQVTWGEAIEFCRRLSVQKQLKYTLPNESQWEYACRATKTTPYAYGDTLSPEVANYDSSAAYAFGPIGTSRQETNEVGSFPTNSWGLEDMHGNVWEWCLDDLHDNPSKIINKGQQQTKFENKDLRMLRGGSWYNIPSYCRSTTRRYVDAWERSHNIGFRICANHLNICS